MTDTAATLASVPGVSAREAATQGFVFNHTMLRVKDAKASLDFSTRVLGFSLVRRSDFPEAAFSLYFLAIVDPAEIPDDDAARKAYVAVLEIIEPPKVKVADGQIPPEDPVVASYRRRLSSVVLS